MDTFPQDVTLVDTTQLSPLVLAMQPAAPLVTIIQQDSTPVGITMQHGNAAVEYYVAVQHPCWIGYSHAAPV